MTSLKEILNLDKAELVFQRLLEAVEAHSSELAAVRRDVSGKASAQDLRGMCTEINSRLTALERRVSATEAAVTIPEGAPGDRGGDGLGHQGRGFVGRRALTVGEAVRANEEALLGLSTKLAGKAGTEELTAKGEQLEACIRERERAVRQWGVGRDFADSLGQAHRGLARKLQAVEGVLGTKLDRSEIDNVQAACAKVSTVSEFLDEAGQRLSTLEAGLERGKQERRESERDAEVAFRELRSGLADRADRHASESVAQELADLRKAFVEETTSKARQLRGLRLGADELKKSLGSFFGSNNERLRELEACLQGAATKREVALKADARHTEESLRALREDLGQRARQASLSSLERTVSQLDREHAKTRKASDLTGRFVDWFSSRGQAYEHNLAAVERHIENLATRSVGARARPASAAAAALDAARGAERMARGDVDGGDGGGDLLRGDTGFLHGGEGGRGGGVFSSSLAGEGGFRGRVPYGDGVRFTPA
eukprot:g14366.t1